MFDLGSLQFEQQNLATQQGQRGWSAGCVEPHRSAALFPEKVKSRPCRQAASTDAQSVSKAGEHWQ